MTGNKSVATLHVLLSSMGANGSKATCYYLDNANDGEFQAPTVESGFSATALWQLLPEAARPDEIWFILTRKAEEEAWSSIQKEASKLGVNVRPIRLSDTGEANDTNAFLSKVAEELPEGVNLTLDVTQGLRHHAFLFFALALYVSKFRSNTVRGIWYSRIETENMRDAKPVIDLKPVLDLAHWFLALSEFQDTGSLKAMSRLVESPEVKDEFAQLSVDFLTGLPLEAGISASKLVETLKVQDFQLAKIPLEENVRNLILVEVEKLAGTAKAKEEYRPDDKEIKRQAHFISRYLETGQDNLAFGLMREWLINRILTNRDPENWLKSSTRRQIEEQLGTLSALNKKYKNSSGKRVCDPNKAVISKEFAEVTQDWDDVSDSRNTLQHHGMRPSGLPVEKAKRLRDKWQQKEMWDRWDSFPVYGGGQKKLLVSPLGQTPGSLYTALMHTSPDRCLVLCSPATQQFVMEAARQSGWDGADAIDEKLKVVIMTDVHQGVEEFEPLLEQAKTWLFEADYIEANLTGGTSLMGVLIGRFLEHANRSYRRPTRRFVLIDRRSNQDQKDNPWVKGELHYVDSEPIKSGDPR